MLGPELAEGFFQLDDPLGRRDPRLAPGGDRSLRIRRVKSAEFS